MIRTTVTAENLADLALAVKFEDNGKELRKELLQNLRKAVKPAAAGAKSSIMSMPSTGLRNTGGSLRRAIAKEIRTEVKLSASAAKVRVRVRKRTIRGFTNPARRTNLAQGWRHPVLPFRRGKDGTVEKIPREYWNWVSQVGKPGWFDDSMKKHRAEYRAAVQKAMDKTADRIARRVN